MRKLPHEGVYCRLKPSKIHGVGVFAIRDIPKGTLVFSEDDEPMVWVDKKSIRGLPRAMRDLYDDFSIIKGDRYGCPRHFDALTISWYLNHSDRPNVAADSHFRFHALRKIRSGEELTSDYRAYSEHPKGAMARRRKSRP